MGGAGARSRRSPNPPIRAASPRSPARRAPAPAPPRQAAASDRASGGGWRHHIRGPRPARSPASRRSRDRRCRRSGRARRSRPTSASRRQASPLIAPSTRARAAASSQSGASSSTASSRRPSAASGLCSASSASSAPARGFDQRAVGLGQLGLEPIARLLRLGPRVDRAPDLGEQRFDRPERRAFRQPPQPAVRGHGPRRLDGGVERPRAFLVIAGDIHQPGRKARAAVRASGLPARRSSAASRSLPARPARPRRSNSAASNR